jgi:hypothetical protein
MIVQVFPSSVMQCSVKEAGDVVTMSISYQVLDVDVYESAVGRERLNRWVLVVQAP